MIISETYKNRLKELAGIQLNEIEFDKKMELFGKDRGKFTFNQNAMVQAIKNGAEVGISFQSDNEKYKMPVAKYRIIHPVAIGTSKDGNLVVRAIHIAGQSEKEAIQTGRRSAETENVWRLLSAKNIKNMWFTGRYFSDVLPGYSKNDSSMRSQIASFDRNEAIKNQDEMRANGIDVELA